MSLSVIAIGFIGMYVNVGPRRADVAQYAPSRNRTPHMSETRRSSRDRRRRGLAHRCQTGNHTVLTTSLGKFIDRPE
jgi:hypothetical protein